MDPFLDLIQLLRPRATLWRRIDAAGDWGVSFRKRDDLLFCWVAAGECQVVRPGEPDVRLVPGDFMLIRTSTPFTLTSDPSVVPEDSEIASAAADGPVLRFGSGAERPTVLHGGRFLFDNANESLLTGLMPQLLRVAATESAAWRVQSLLRMNAAESTEPGPGSDFVIARLMELILVEILRYQALRTEANSVGLLAGMADPVTARALRAMHKEVARPWTVAALARLGGVSRSTFASRFAAVMGTGPMEYLQQWRMAVAKDKLRNGTQTVAEIAFAVGFQSASAFSTAFSKAVGCSPRRYQELTRAEAEPSVGSGLETPREQPGGMA